MLHETLNQLQTCIKNQSSNHAHVKPHPLTRWSLQSDQLNQDVVTQRSDMYHCKLRREAHPLLKTRVSSHRAKEEKNSCLASPVKGVGHITNTH